MITERLMANGEFSLSFTRDAGLWDFSRVSAWGTLVITPTRLSTVTNSWASIVKNSCYIGLVDTVNMKQRTISGRGIVALLGDGERGPNVGTVITKTAATLDAWLTDIIPGGGASNGITKGAVTNPVPTITDSIQYITRREALEKVCLACGAEWKVVPNTSTGAIEVAAAVPATLFADYTTPKTLVVRNGASRDAGIRSAHTLDLSNTVDVEEYVTSVTAIGRGDGGAEVQTASGSTVYYGPFGHALDMGIVIDAPEVKRGQTAGFATSMLAQRSSAKNTTTLSTDTYNLPVDVRPGDRIAVFDPDQGLYDTANSMIYEGRQVSPAYVRVVGWKWPKRNSMGVYYRLPGSSDVVLDLSEQIEDEAGAATAEIGAWSRGVVSWTVAGVPGSPKVTGDLPKAVTVETLPSYSPQIVQGSNVPTGINHALHFRVGRMVFVDVRVYATAVGTGGQHAVVTLPVTPLTSGVASPVLGSAYVFTAGTWYPCTAFIDPATARVDFIAAGAVGFSGALAVNDIIAFAGWYPAATP